MTDNTRNSPVAPLPNVGEGGPVYSGEDNTPVVPLPNPGEGGPVGGDAAGAEPVVPLPNPGEGGPVNGNNSSNGAEPVIPLPNPGEGGPVGGGVIVRPLPGQRPGVIPIFPRAATIRYLNAAYGYAPFRIYINNRQAVSFLGSASVTSYRRIGTGYQQVTVAGLDGYIYVQKSMLFESGSISTLAIINSASGLDIIQIPDSCCLPSGGTANFRVSNLAYNSRPMDVLLGDGRVVYSDIRFKETASYKRIQPGAYQFLFAETNLTAMPAYLDIETLDSAFLTMEPTSATVATLYLNVRPNANYTVYLISSGPAVNAVQTLVVTDQ